MAQNRVNDTQLGANCTIKLGRTKLDQNRWTECAASVSVAVRVRFGQLMASTYRKIKSLGPAKIAPNRETNSPLMVIICFINSRSIPTGVLAPRKWQCFNCAARSERIQTGPARIDHWPAIGYWTSLALRILSKIALI